MEKYKNVPICPICKKDMDIGENPSGFHVWHSCEEFEFDISFPIFPTECAAIDVALNIIKIMQFHNELKSYIDENKYWDLSIDIEAKIGYNFVVKSAFYL